jgi:hypothetical protein
MSEGNRDYVGEALKRVSSSPEADISTARFNGGDYPALGDNTAAQQPAWKIGSFSAKELQSMTLPPLSWIVPNIIPAEGVTLLCSKPKFGKSWLAYNLCIACTTDRYTLGTIKPAQGDVLYLGLLSRQNGAASTNADLKISEHGMLTQRKRAGNRSWSWSMCSRR